VDIKNLIENKKNACLRYLTTRSKTDKLEYKRLVAIVKRETKKLKAILGNICIENWTCFTWPPDKCI